MYGFISMKLQNRQIYSGCPELQGGAVAKEPKRTFQGNESIQDPIIPLQDVLTNKIRKHALEDKHKNILSDIICTSSNLEIHKIVMKSKQDI